MDDGQFTGTPSPALQLSVALCGGDVRVLSAWHAAVLERSAKLCDPCNADKPDGWSEVCNETQGLLNLLREACDMLSAIGCSPEGIDRTVAEAEALQARIELALGIT